jgi:hypothetical protein
MSVIEPNTADTLEDMTLTVSWYMLATSSMPAYGMVNEHFPIRAHEYIMASECDLLSSVQNWQLYGAGLSHDIACEVEELVSL